VTVFGKRYDTPREIAAFGDSGVTYTYSGCKIDPSPWTPDMLAIKAEVEARVGEVFNFCLVNAYRDGKDCIGWHRDNEKDLDPKAPIASLSFGESRDFLVREIDGEAKEKLCLETGDLIAMDYPTNQLCEHSLPKRLKSKKLRLNLTFRKIVVKG
jgi:alpha-ketoglutarate-dependent dioxygenase alkB family protein 2